jgi:hypothetical protein
MLHCWVSGVQCQEVFLYFFTLKDKGTLSFEMSRTDHLVVQQHIQEEQSPPFMLTFFSRYEHFFKEFGTFRQDLESNVLLKSWDANLPLYGNLQFGQKKYEEECHEEILSDSMFSQFCSYKMPSLADDTCPVKQVMNTAEYGQSVHNSDVTLNTKNIGGHSTVQSLSSVMLTLEANKNGVSVPPVSKG